MLELKYCIALDQTPQKPVHNLEWNICSLNCISQGKGALYLSLYTLFSYCGSLLERVHVMDAYKTDLGSQTIFWSKNPLLWRHYGYLSADRDRASPNSNCKITYLIFRTLDWAASDVMPTIANESQLLTDCLGGCKHDLDISNVLFTIIYNWL